MLRPNASDQRRAARGRVGSWERRRASGASGAGAWSAPLGSSAKLCPAVGARHSLSEPASRSAPAPASESRWPSVQHVDASSSTAGPAAERAASHGREADAGAGACAGAGRSAHDAGHSRERCCATGVGPSVQRVAAREVARVQRPQNANAAASRACFCWWARGRLGAGQRLSGTSEESSCLRARPAGPLNRRLRRERWD